MGQWWVHVAAIDGTYARSIHKLIFNLHDHICTVAECTSFKWIPKLMIGTKYDVVIAWRKVLRNYFRVHQWKKLYE